MTNLQHSFHNYPRLLISLSNQNTGMSLQNWLNPSKLIAHTNIINSSYMLRKKLFEYSLSRRMHIQLKLISTPDVKFNFYPATLITHWLLQRKNGLNQLMRQLPNTPPLLLFYLRWSHQKIKIIINYHLLPSQTQPFPSKSNIYDRRWSCNFFRALRN